jgi:hypothetical protein
MANEATKGSWVLSTHPEQHTTTRTVVVGLVADPGLPGDLAQGLSKALPAKLREGVDAGVAWEVRVAREALPLSEDGEIRLSASASRLCEREGWDYMVCLTELPRRVETRPLLYDVRVSAGAGVVSLPALGLTRCAVGH